MICNHFAMVIFAPRQPPIKLLDKGGENLLYEVRLYGYSRLVYQMPNEWVYTSGVINRLTPIAAYCGFFAV